MATDEDYMAFLNKANEDASEASANNNNKKGGAAQLKATDADAQIPPAIRDAVADAFYVSDADEPFVPVSLAWPDAASKGLPDQGELARLISHPDAAQAAQSIELLDPADWDPRGQYAGVVEAARAATKGADVRVYRVPTGGARAEYWVISAADGRLVGAKALAVES